MKKRQAKKIVKQNLICCARYFGGPEQVATAGSIQYPEHTYRKALHTLLRQMEREARIKAPGCIERMAEINNDMTQERLRYLVGKAA